MPGERETLEQELALRALDLERRLAEALDVVSGYDAAADAERYLAAVEAGERSGVDPSDGHRAQS